MRNLARSYMEYSIEKSMGRVPEGFGVSKEQHDSLTPVHYESVKAIGSLTCREQGHCEEGKYSITINLSNLADDASSIRALRVNYIQAMNGVPELKIQDTVGELEIADLFRVTSSLWEISSKVQAVTTA